MNPPTVNANPVIREISQSSRRKHASQYPELAAMSVDALFPQGGDSSDDGFSQLVLDAESTHSLRPSSTRQQQFSPDSLAVVHALMDASVATNGKSVSLLRNIGLRFPTNVEQLEEMQGAPWAISSISTNTFFSKSPAAAAAAAAAGSIPKYTSGQEEEEDTKEDESKQQQQQQDWESIDVNEIFDIIRNIQDPEHPLTLEQLGVVSRGQIEMMDEGPYTKVDVRFTPTIPHCSMATQIGLAVQVKLDRSLGRQFKTRVRIEPGTHASEKAINKQLADKERVAAALENKHLLEIVNKCILHGMMGEIGQN